MTDPTRIQNQKYHPATGKFGGTAIFKRMICVLLIVFSSFLPAAPKELWVRDRILRPGDRLNLYGTVAELIDFRPDKYGSFDVILKRGTYVQDLALGYFIDKIQEKRSEDQWLRDADGNAVEIGTRPATKLTGFNSEIHLGDVVEVDGVPKRIIMETSDSYVFDPFERLRPYPDEKGPRWAERVTWKNQIGSVGDFRGVPKSSLRLFLDDYISGKMCSLALRYGGLTWQGVTLD